MRGSVKVTMYDFDDTIIDESVINVGDISVTFEGGHTYDILEDDTIVYEYKTAPIKVKKTIRCLYDNTMISIRS